MKKIDIQHYVNNFRRRLSPYLKPDLGMSCRILPVWQGGAVLEFRLGQDIENDDRYEPYRDTLSEAVASVKQKAFGGNLTGFRFTGTNTILEPGRLIFIKDGTAASWSDKQAKEDVLRVISPPGDEK